MFALKTIFCVQKNLKSKSATIDFRVYVGPNEHNQHQQTLIRTMLQFIQIIPIIIRLLYASL